MGIGLLLAFLPWHMAWGQEGGLASLQKLNAMMRALPKFSGTASASFGQYTEEIGAASGVSELENTYTVIDADLVLTGKRDVLNYYFSLHLLGTQGGSFVRGGQDSTGTFNTGQIESGRVRMRWMPNQTFSISIGRLPDLDNTGFAAVQPVENLISPDGYAQYTLLDQGAIDFKFNLGNLNLGFALSSSCEPACNADASGKIFDVQTQSSTLFYLSYTRPSFGLGFRTQLAEGEGLDNGAGEIDLGVETESNAGVVELYMRLGAIYLGLELTSTTLPKVTALGTPMANSPREGIGTATKDDMALGIRLGGKYSVHALLVSEDTKYAIPSSLSGADLVGLVQGFEVTSIITGFEKKGTGGSWGVEIGSREAKTTFANTDSSVDKTQIYGFFIKSVF